VLTRPRPPRSCLLAGRFLASRAALLARPAGPLAAVDVATAAPVRLVKVARGIDHDALRLAVMRWNGLARAGAPPVLELADHDGVAVLVLTARAGAPLRCSDGPQRVAFQRAASALGAALDSLDLGLLPGRDAELAVVAGELALSVPAVGPADASRPLADVLPAAVPDAASTPAVVPSTSTQRRARWRPSAHIASLARRRPGRALVLAMAAGALALGFALAGSLLGPAGPATASPWSPTADVSASMPARTSVVRAPAASTRPRRPSAHVRGGPSRAVVSSRRPPRVQVQARARASPLSLPRASPAAPAPRLVQPSLRQPPPDPRAALCRAQGLCP
jgi:hypothetical protein